MPHSTLGLHRLDNARGRASRAGDGPPPKGRIVWKLFEKVPDGWQLEKESEQPVVGARLEDGAVLPPREAFSGTAEEFAEV